MYDATIGRWTSEDPLGLSPDINPYRYVGNAPTDATDPSGLEKRKPAPTDVFFDTGWKRNETKLDYLYATATKRGELEFKRGTPPLFEGFVTAKIALMPEKSHLYGERRNYLGSYQNFAITITYDTWNRPWDVQGGRPFGTAEDELERIEKGTLRFVYFRPRDRHIRGPVFEFGDKADHVGWNNEKFKSKTATWSWIVRVPLAGEGVKAIGPDFITIAMAQKFTAKDWGWTRDELKVGWKVENLTYDKRTHDLIGYKASVNLEEFINAGHGAVPATSHVYKGRK